MSITQFVSVASEHAWVCRRNVNYQGFAASRLWGACVMIYHEHELVDTLPSK